MTTGAGLACGDEKGTGMDGGNNATMNATTGGAMDSWKQRMQVAADAYAALDEQLTEWVGGMSDADVAKLRDDCGRPTDTNCWWATHRVAPILRDVIGAEQVRRSRHAAECSS